VNLLPPEVEQHRRARKVQVGLGAGVVAALGVVGAMTLLAAGQVSDAQDDVAAANARHATLEAKAAEYAEVPVVYAQVEAARTQLSEAMGQEIRWSYFLNDLSLTTPSKVWLTKMTVEQNVDGAATAAVAPVASTGQYLDAGIGTVTFEGKGSRHNDVAAWLDSLAKAKGLTQPYFTRSEVELIGTEKSVTFESQATVTEKALSGRYTQKAGS
ncbi:MAG TPA: PilN domain-containing protein, partial [Actinomycetes bacterium]|nr:PilN domain-containing protein [Actinomycetes bacterium]